MADDAAVQILERGITERLGVHRRELDHLSETLGEVRDDLAQALSDIDARLAAIEKTQALQALALETNTSIVGVAVKVGIGVAIAVLASAVAVIFFGPAA